MKTIWKSAVLLSIFAVTITTLVILGPQLFQSEDGPDQNPDGGTEPSVATTVSNLTLILDYGNGTIDRWEHLQVTAVKPSVFHLLEQKCNPVEYEDYNYDVLITGLNGKNGNETADWHFWVNGTYSPVGAKMARLSNDTWVEWRFQIND